MLVAGVVAAEASPLQSGSNPGAVLNEVSAVTKRLIEGLLEDNGTNVPLSVAKSFGRRRSRQGWRAARRDRDRRP